ncbi:hypothetical protein Tco_1416997 [Tanacetum coccineum]
MELWRHFLWCQPYWMWCHSFSCHSVAFLLYVWTHGTTFSGANEGATKCGAIAFLVSSHFYLRGNTFWCYGLSHDTTVPSALSGKFPNNASRFQGVFLSWVVDCINLICVDMSIYSGCKSVGSFSCWLLIGSSGYPSVVGDVLDKVGLGVSVNITGLGSSVDTGSGSACLTGGAGRGSIVFVKTVSNTKSFFLEVLLESKWNWKM